MGSVDLGGGSSVWWEMAVGESKKRGLYVPLRCGVRKMNVALGDYKSFLGDLSNGTPRLELRVISLLLLNVARLGL